MQLSPEAEALALRLAKVRGIAPEDAIREALEEAQKAVTRDVAARRPLDRHAMIERMETIAVRSTARPLVDPRSADELIGFDEFGVPR